MAQAQASDRTSEPTASSTKNNSGVGFFVGSSATVLTNRAPGAHKHGVVGSTPVSNANRLRILLNQQALSRMTQD